LAKGAGLTPAALLVLAFLEFFPRPVCTFDHVQVALQAPDCPRHDITTDSGLIRTERGLMRCARRFKL
jgi:hypothetical protein